MENSIIEGYLTELVKQLKTHDPLTIILFGSFSKGNYNEDSDIDLLVVLDSDLLPRTYEEKMMMKASLRKSIIEINRQIAIDLLVYTKREMEILRSEDNAFLDEISKTGRVMYEKAS